MIELSTEARELLARTRALHEPRAGERARVRSAIARQLAAGAAGVIGLSSAHTAASALGGGTSAALRGSVLAKWLFSGFLLGSAGVVAVHAGTQALASHAEPRIATTSTPGTAGSHSARRSAVAVRAPSAPPSGEPDTPPEPEVVVPERAPSHSAVTQPKAKPSEPKTLPSSAAFPAAGELPTYGASSTSGERVAASPSERAPQSASAPRGELGAEARALRDAQEALDRGQPGLALTLLEQQRVKFGRGVLGDERAAARIFALCALGRRAEAQAESSRFITTAASSPLAARVRTACTGE